MKKLLTFILIIAMMFSLTMISFAQEAGETEQIVEETSNKITQIIGVSGAVGVGAIIVAVIAFFLSNFKKIQGVINSMASVFKSIFSKTDGKIENIPQAFNQINDDLKSLTKDFNKDLDVVKEKLEQAETKNDQLMQVFSVFIINCSYINPYAKAELIQLLSGTKEFGENIVETMKRIEESIALAKASEEKMETPYLDKVVDVVEGE